MVNGGCIWAKPSNGGFEHEVTNLRRSAVSCRHMHRGDGERGGGGVGGSRSRQPSGTSAENSCRTDQKSRMVGEKSV